MSPESSSSEKRLFPLGVAVIILIAAIVVSSLAFLLINQRRGSDFSYTIYGAVNLTTWNETKGMPVTLEKGWEFYAGQLLSPEMIHNSREENAKDGRIWVMRRNFILSVRKCRRWKLSA